MRALGFKTLLPDALQAPIIVTFHTPSHPNFVFQRFYDALKDRGYVIYPGKLTVANSFRIGCIGRLYPRDMRGALEAVSEILHEMGVRAGPTLQHKARAAGASAKAAANTIILRIIGFPLCRQAQSSGISAEWQPGRRSRFGA